MMKFEIFRGDDGQFYFHLRAANGEKIAQSEGYTRKESARETILSIQRSAATADVEDRA